MSVDIVLQASVQLSSFRVLPNLSPLQTGLALASAGKSDDKIDASVESISYMKGAEAELLGGRTDDSGEDSLNGSMGVAKLSSAEIGVARNSMEIETAIDSQAIVMKSS